MQRWPIQRHLTSWEIARDGLDEAHREFPTSRFTDVVVDTDRPFSVPHNRQSSVAIVGQEHILKSPPLTSESRTRLGRRPRLPIRLLFVRVPIRAKSGDRSPRPDQLVVRRVLS